MTIWGFKNRKQINLSQQQSLWLAPPEYVIIRKLQYYKEGHSPKHLSDIKKMLNTGVGLDGDFLQEMIMQLDLAKIWDKQVRN